MRFWMTQELNGALFKDLARAVYIMDCLVKGQPKWQIVYKFNGDEQLVAMLISFLIHSQWVKQDGQTGEWAMTAKSETWIVQKYGRIPSPYISC